MVNQEQRFAAWRSPVIWLEWGALLASYALIGYFILIFPQRVGLDMAYYIYLSRTMVDGQVPYVDFFETNPPLIMYLHALPAVVAQITSISIIPLFSSMILAATVWSSLAIRHFLNRYLPEPHILATVIPLAVSLHSFKTMVWNDFGQREHLFILLYLPLFFARWLRWENVELNRWAMMGVGALGIIGALLKPYFLVMAFVPEVYWFVTRRDIKRFIQPEFITMISVGIIYVLHFLVVPAGMRNNFFGWVMPLLFKGYNVYDMPLVDMLEKSDTQLMAVAGLIALVPLPRRWSRLESFMRPLGVFTLAGMLIYLVQHKGWYYQTIPGFQGVVIIAAIRGMDLVGFFVDRVPRLGRSGNQLIQLGVFVAICAYIVIPYTDTLQKYEGEDDNFRQVIADHTQSGDRILFFDSSIWPAFPLILHMDFLSGSRYLWSFPIPVIYKDVGYDATGKPDYLSRADTPENERFLEELAADIAQYRPKLILVNLNRCQGCPAEFNILEYLNAVDFVDSAMADYIRLDDVYQRTLFAVFQRTEPLTESATPSPVEFGDQFRLVAWEVDGTPTACESITVTTWWELLAPVSINYSMGLSLLENGAGVTNVDGAPAQIDTTRWEQNRVYSDQRHLTLPCADSAHEYGLAIIFYDYLTMERLTATGAEGIALGDIVEFTTIQTR